MLSSPYTSGDNITPDAFDAASETRADPLALNVESRQTTWQDALSHTPLVPFIYLGVGYLDGHDARGLWRRI